MPSDPFDGSLIDVSKQGYEFFIRIPSISPRKAYKILESKGYRGQDFARRVMSLAAYRHVKRIKQIYLNGTPRESLPPKSNILLMGPTGCGKTFLVELLFQHILKLPTVIVDITGFSETGYVGDDTKTILTRLLLAAKGNSSIASAGVVCLDEFDKLASCSNVARFDGQGTTKDVSGYGVQRELLKMFESTYMDIPTDFNNTIYSVKQRLFTGDVMFIASGTFSGFKGNILYNKGAPRIGFKSGANYELKIAQELAEGEVNDIENFQSYGFIPELIGRFTRIVPLSPLDRDTLRSILIDNVIVKFKNEFLSENLTLEVEEPVIDHMVEKSFERQTGARGLCSLLTQYIEDAAFRYFGFKEGKVVLKMKNGNVVSEIT